MLTLYFSACVYAASRQHSAKAELSCDSAGCMAHRQVPAGGAVQCGAGGRLGRPRRGKPSSDFCVTDVLVRV